MRNNAHMGPNSYPGTWQAALDRGHHVGAVCSTDNWGDMPGHFGNGRMAALATALTREALWEAFRARRVYGVTGDRIQLEFRVNDAPMGAVIQAAGPRRIRVRVVGSDEIDRIELLRNGRVIATHCHQGTWSLPEPGHRTRFKMRVETGWGPRPNELPMPDRQWTGELAVDGGRMIAYEPCWILPGQTPPVFDGGRARFGFLTSAKHLNERSQNANVFEFGADPAAPLRVTLNGLEESGTVADFARGSREMWYKDECVRMVAEHDRHRARFARAGGYLPPRSLQSQAPPPSAGSGLDGGDGIRRRHAPGRRSPLPASASSNATPSAPGPAPSGCGRSRWRGGDLPRRTDALVSSAICRSPCSPHAQA